MVHTLTQNIHTIIQTHTVSLLLHKKTQSDTKHTTHRQTDIYKRKCTLKLKQTHEQTNR
jgi:hypothetical protein